MDLQAIVVGWICTHLVEFLKKSTSVPWINQASNKSQQIVSAILACVASVGISCHWDPTAGTLMVTGLTTTAFANLAYTALQQYVLQTLIYRVGYKDKATEDRVKLIARLTPVFVGFVLLFGMSTPAYAQDQMIPKTLGDAEYTYTYQQAVKAGLYAQRADIAITKSLDRAVKYEALRAHLMTVTGGGQDALDEINVRWLKFSEGFFVAGQLADSISTWYMLGKKDANGNPVYEEGNPFLPDNRIGIVLVKVGATAGGVAIAEQLWKDGHKWQAVAVMSAAGIISFGAAGNNLVAAYRNGDLPWQGVTPASMAKIRW